MPSSRIYHIHFKFGKVYEANHNSNKNMDVTKIEKSEMKPKSFDIHQTCQKTHNISMESPLPNIQPETTLFLQRGWYTRETKHNLRAKRPIGFRCNTQLQCSYMKLSLKSSRASTFHTSSIHTGSILK